MGYGPDHIELPDDLLAAEPSTATVRLPGHDQWVMGVGTKDEHVNPPAMRDLMTRKANPYTGKGRVLAPGRTGRVAYRFPSDAPRFLTELVVTRIGYFAGGQREVRHDADAGHGVLDHAGLCEVETG